MPMSLSSNQEFFLNLSALQGTLEATFCVAKERKADGFHFEELNVLCFEDLSLPDTEGRKG
jgi:hypothetical protein